VLKPRTQHLGLLTMASCRRYQYRLPPRPLGGFISPLVDIGVGSISGPPTRIARGPPRSLRFERFLFGDLEMFGEVLAHVFLQSPFVR
jgi:hypothetical protein